jgi:TetR/AcrR family transcriptional repressor of nem operon
MARKKEFDRNAALQKAIEVFREKGYAATSTADLLGRMRIGRQNMYDTFGDKRTLYLEALRLFNTESVSKFAYTLHIPSPPSPLTGLQLALHTFAAKAPTYHERGCMGINAVCEFGQKDTDVAKINESSSMALASSLRHVLMDARGEDELVAGIDEQIAADFISATLTGMKVAARAGVPAARLHGVADMVISALQKKRTT